MKRREKRTQYLTIHIGYIYSRRKLCPLFYQVIQVFIVGKKLDTIYRRDLAGDWRRLKVSLLASFLHFVHFGSFLASCLGFTYMPQLGSLHYYILAFCMQPLWIYGGGQSIHLPLKVYEWCFTKLVTLSIFVNYINKNDLLPSILLSMF